MKIYKINGWNMNNKIIKKIKLVMKIMSKKD